MSFVSKYQIQENIGHQHFPATDYISPDQSIDQLHQQLTRFTDANAYPVIVKPDEGMTGRGIVSIRSADDIPRACRLVEGFPYMVQAYVPGDFEFGVFWYRLNGQCKISGINQKHFPTVTGDGQSAVGELARKHPRYTSFWESFLKERDDLETILPATQQKILSRIGSHTMGCRFTDETQLANDAILSRINSVFTDFPGYNYGRLDVKSLSLEAFISGEFDVIEVNGIESQATHMFDPKYGFSDALKILNEHARILAQVSADQRSQKTSLISYPKLITETIRNVQDVQNHQQRAEDL